MASTTTTFHSTVFFFSFFLSFFLSFSFFLSSLYYKFTCTVANFIKFYFPFIFFLRPSTTTRKAMIAVIFLFFTNFYKRGFGICWKL